MISWAVVAIIFFLIGFGIGIISAKSENNLFLETTAQNEIMIFEKPDKKKMAYNMGENGISRLWEQGIFKINYSKSVLQIQRDLNAKLERGGAD
jgi:hypothetical protein